MGIFIKQFLLQITHQSSLKMLLILLVLAGSAVGQSQSTKEKCKNSKKCKGQQTYKTYKNKYGKEVRSGVSARSNYNNQKGLVSYPRRAKAGSLEKSIQVNSKKVFIQLCVTQGKVKVNGWNRKEVRAFINGGEGLGIRVREKSSRDKKPVWLDVVGYNPKSRFERRSRTRKPYNKCLSGKDIELDVPQYADVKLQVRSGDASIGEIKTAKLTVINGDILVNNIEKRTEAHTHQGSITIRNSGGRMSVSTTTGNIIAFNTESNEIGDYFKAKTRSGAVTLQSIGQKEVEASSVSGTLNYIGKIKNYGQYGFSTTNGLINLVLPSSSSFRLTATYGGAFQSVLPLTDLVKSRTGSIVFLTGRVGEGEANVNLKSFNGAIRIRKQGEERLAKLFR